MDKSSNNSHVCLDVECGYAGEIIDEEAERGREAGDEDEVEEGQIDEKDTKEVSVDCASSALILNKVDAVR